MRFGPAGKSIEYQDISTIDTIKSVSSLGLDAFEYQCGHGTKRDEAEAKVLGNVAEDYGIELSIHSPYYISLSNIDKVDKNIEYMRQCARLAGWFRSKRIVVHCGSTLNLPRDVAIKHTKANLLAMLKVSKDESWPEILWCIETMGKQNQLGSYREVVEICKIDERLIPCFDFGHLYARSLGFHTDFTDVFEYVTNELGTYRSRICHVHYSKIAYTKGGEKHHLRIDDFAGPQWQDLAGLLRSYDWQGTVICESAGTQTADCRLMQRVYNSII